MNKNILVTGGSGMVGKYLKNILPEATYMSSKDCDLRDSKQVDEFWGEIKPDVVIHLGAKVGGILENLESPADFYNENTLINTNVLMMSKKHNVKRFTGILSTCMYPDVVDNYPMTEKDVHLGNPNQCHFITALIRKIIDSENQGRDEITLFGTGEPLRQFMYAGDLAKTIKLVIENDITDSFNVATPEENNIRDMAEITLNALGKDMNVVFDTDKPDGQYRKTVSCKKMLESVGDFEFTKLEDGVKKVYNEVIKEYGK